MPAAPTVLYLCDLCTNYIISDIQKTGILVDIRNGYCTELGLVDKYCYQQFMLTVECGQYGTDTGQ